MILALALAAEIGANAPAYLKPCSAPVLERLAKPGDPQYERMTHIRKLPEVCTTPGPLSSFAEMAEPVSPLPEATIAAAQTPDDREVGTVVSPSPENFDGVTSGAAAFTYLPGAISTVYLPAPIPPAPEPTTVYLLAAGLLALVWRRA